jgi:hypothetical protein
MMMSGCFFSSARCPARAIFSPTTEPIEPPMNAKSITPRFTGMPSSVPAAVTIASDSPACRRAFRSRCGYSGKPSGSAERDPTSVSSQPSSRRMLQ